MDAPKPINPHTPHTSPPPSTHANTPRSLSHLGARIRHLAQLAASEHHARLLTTQARATLALTAQSTTEARA